MASQQIVSRKSAHRLRLSGRLDPSGPGSARLVHLCGMETTTRRGTVNRASSEGRLDPVVTLSQLAAQLGVSVQTLYDLRSQGRGPRGFRVGRELRFRVSEIAAWLTQLEADDAERHPREAG
jgi:excisionase family DNA binding protein